MSLSDVSYLASEQAGLFTTAQASKLGIDRVKLHRGVQQGILRSPRRGVYAFESSPFPPDEELRAAWLSLNPSHTVAERLQIPQDIVICTTSAAAHYGIGDFDTYQHEFYTARRKQSRADDIRLRIRDLNADDVDIVQGLPLTTPTRIVLDLLSERFDLGHISRMIFDAVRKGLQIEWPRIAEQASKLSATYDLDPEGLILSLGEASESPSDTARTALSMMGSFPEINHYFTKQLADSMREISIKILSSPQMTEVAANAGKIMNSVPALQALQDTSTELTKDITVPLQNISALTLASVFNLDAFQEYKSQSKNTATPTDSEDREEKKR